MLDVGVLIVQQPEGFTQFTNYISMYLLINGNDMPIFIFRNWYTGGLSSVHSPTIYDP